jgi:integrase/recombinase XerC
MAGKQAKILTPQQFSRLLDAVEKHRHPVRDRAIIYLSAKAGLRACEITGLLWGMVTDADGTIGDALYVENRIAKGKRGREIPMNSELRSALIDLKGASSRSEPHHPIIQSERGNGAMTASSLVHWFDRLYHGLGLDGCSSHSGRRTFVTRAAISAVKVGASLRDVQQMAGHSSLQTTQRYIEGSSDAKKKLVDLI